MNSNDMNNEVEVVKKNFKQWLKISSLSEEDFLKYRTIMDFRILNAANNGYKIIVLGYISKGSFVKIGEQLAYQEHDLSGFEDLSLLLLFMAQKLDSENQKAPKFEQRPNYFFNKVKTFIKEQDEYTLIAKR